MILCRLHTLPSNTNTYLWRFSGSVIKTVFCQVLMIFFFMYLSFKFYTACTVYKTRDIFLRPCYVFIANNSSTRRHTENTNHNLACKWLNFELFVWFLNFVLWNDTCIYLCDTKVVLVFVIHIACNSNFIFWTLFRLHSRGFYFN